MKRTATTLIAALMALILTACGGDETPATRTGPQQEPAAASGQAQPNAVLPTRPQRISSLLTPTPEPVERADPGSSETAETPPEQQPKAEAGTPAQNRENPGNGDSTLSLIPENPQLTDEVLLQDIYQQMDLSQFALDPRDPIPFREEPGHRYYGPSTEPIRENIMKLNFAEARANPFLHVFPILEETLRIEDMDKAGAFEGLGLGDETHALIHPNLLVDTLGRDYLVSYRLIPFIPRDPITYFLHHPWFEPVDIKVPGRDGRLSGSGKYYPRENGWFGTQFSLGPHWFGENSTRGVLSESVAQALKDAQYPNVRSQPLLWEERYKWHEKDWDLDDYLRTTMAPPQNASRENSLLRYSPSDQGKDSVPELARAYPGGPVYQTPWTYWELAHPKLPIVHITSYQETILPLSHPGQESIDLKPTRFAVSFVIAFQNRWTSFQDPNRWLARFPDSYEPSLAHKDTNRNGVMGMVNPKTHENFPNYWHSSDYMQHSLIGPVIVQVYESEVIEPGIYPMTPKVTRWEAPGPIAPDEHLAVEEYHHKGGLALPFTYHPSKPSANWPLPGHVTTTPYTAPGTRRWNEAGMDYWDW